MNISSGDDPQGTLSNLCTFPAFNHILLGIKNGNSPTAPWALSVQVGAVRSTLQLAAASGLWVGEHPALTQYISLESQVLTTLATQGDHRAAMTSCSTWAAL